MTWKEFKEEAERQGIKDDSKLGYIDWCSPGGPGEDDYGSLTVFFKETLVNIFW